MWVARDSVESTAALTHQASSAPRTKRLFANVRSLTSIAVKFPHRFFRFHSGVNGNDLSSAKDLEEDRFGIVVPHRIRWAPLQTPIDAGGRHNRHQVPAWTLIHLKIFSSPALRHQALSVLIATRIETKENPPVNTKEVKFNRSR